MGMQHLVERKRIDERSCECRQMAAGVSLQHEVRGQRVQQEGQQPDKVVCGDGITRRGVDGQRKQA